ncbi:unnamed protein product [Vitrella brassicaformis CCMP3155]|uniref:Uncharacterized protein n=1 Tax=Vitrella brassicaformis (strain CCMP3155) TaxID=1169540 RepID=A0A0G4ETJ6_VITBC|nr:unnamed protein product [Vitrella brassicaformis CCMP3155]|eukprot:CEM01764.1 unnamed protein product [Vitrella brassicaformis CCMP3155]
MDNLAFEMARGGIVDSHGGTANAQKNKALARAHERGGLAMWNGIGYYEKNFGQKEKQGGYLYLIRCQPSAMSDNKEVQRQIVRVLDPSFSGDKIPARKFLYPKGLLDRFGPKKSVRGASELDRVRAAWKNVKLAILRVKKDGSLLVSTNPTAFREKDALMKELRGDQCDGSCQADSF